MESGEIVEKFDGFLEKKKVSDKDRYFVALEMLENYKAKLLYPEEEPEDDEMEDDELEADMEVDEEPKMPAPKPKSAVKRPQVKVKSTVQKEDDF